MCTVFMFRVCDNAPGMNLRCMLRCAWMTIHISFTSQQDFCEGQCLLHMWVKFSAVMSTSAMSGTGKSLVVYILNSHPRKSRVKILGFMWKQKYCKQKW